MVGAVLDRLAAEWPASRRWLVIPFGLVAALALVVTVGLPLYGHGRTEAAALGGDRFVWEVTAAFVPFLLGAAYAWWSSRASAVSRAAASLAAGMGLTTLLAALFLLPAFDAVKSARGLSKVLVSRMAPGETYGIYPRLDNTFLFYTRRFCVDLNSEARLRAFLARPGRVWLLAQRDDLAKVKGLPPLEEIARDQDPTGDGYALLTRP